MLMPQNNNGLIYLFDELPEDFLLFMYGKDLNVQHGNRILNPTSSWNCFTDINSLNQSTACNHGGNYNEVTGYRRNILPSAIACFGDEPTDDQIRASAYFEIPIIKFDIEKYERLKEKKFLDAKSALQEQSNEQAIYDVLYSGIRGFSLSAAIDLIIDSIKNSYASRKIDISEMLLQLVYLRSLVNRIAEPSDRIQIRKIELLINDIREKRKISNDEIINEEVADIGEFVVAPRNPTSK